MKLHQIRDILAVAERGSVRNAARHLGLPQPSLSRSIRALEDELGATLLERGVTGATLTPIGHAFVARALVAQRELDRARQEVDQLNGLGKGRIAIGMANAPHLALLPKALVAFRARFPDVVVKLAEGLFPSMENELREGGLDFYVGPMAEMDVSSDLVVEKLFDNRRVVFGRPGHPLSGARSLRDLSEAQWVVTSVSLASGAELAPIFASLGAAGPNIAVECQTALSIITVAASTNLLAMLPRQWLTFARGSGLLFAFELEETLVAPPICIVRHRRLPLTPVAEYFSERLKQVANNHVRDMAAA